MSIKCSESLVHVKSQGLDLSLSELPSSRCLSCSLQSVNQRIVVNPEKERERSVGIGVPSEKGAFSKRDPDRDELSEISIENRKLAGKRGN